ncbi:sugar diacid recognition domain-containing protein [Sporosarcina sp. A2]|uniref:sugar diacid recognition domain-containing protein n=1 Tax=Sporosarcina sp. A2 TaxID=3393449 RepID=UPI003D797A3C
MHNILRILKIKSAQIDSKELKIQQLKGLNVLKDIGHYAQSIVEQFSSLLDIPISITDNNGVIIGSTDNNRIGSVHLGTAEVSQSGKVLFFSKEQTDDLVNVFPGIAAPLRFQQETVGVLGLIGDPAKVERYVQFVQSHIEMILMESYRSRSVASQMEVMQDFIQRLSSYKEETDYSRIQNYCELHGFTLGIPRRCILLDKQSSNIQVPNLEQTPTFNQEEQALYLFLTKVFVTNEQDVVAPLSKGQWLILLANQPDDSRQMKKRLEVASGKLHKFLDKRDVVRGFMFSYSEPSSSIEGIFKNYEYCKKSLDIAKRHDFQQSFFSIDDWDLLSHGFIEEISLPSQWTLENHIGKLLNHLNGMVLIESFLAYCEEQLNMSQAARKLYIHRNTLLYRLQQLQQVVEIDLHSFKQCTLLYLALKQHPHVDGST